MRIRTIKPDFWRSQDIASLSVEDRLLFVGLWSYVDDNGVGRDEPQLIQCDLFPLDPLTEGSVRVHGGLKHLSERGLITRYEGPDGRRYMQINSFTEHQRINRPSKPRYPQYDAENCTLTEPSVSPHDTLTEGSPLEQGTGNRESNTPYKSPKGDSVTADAATLDDDGDALIDAPVAPPAPSSKTPKPKTSRHRRETYPPEFEAFWDAYPKKADKRAALRAWKRAVAEVDNDRLVEAARAYAADPARKPDYTKNAATWLNAGSWDNQPAEPSTPRVVSMWDYVGGLTSRSDVSGDPLAAAPTQYPTDMLRTGLERPNTPDQVPHATPRKVHAR